MASLASASFQTEIISAVAGASAPSNRPSVPGRLSAATPEAGCKAGARHSSTRSPLRMAKT
jgi:hypothetical protein